jgi:protein-tyrosine kinase
MSAPSSPTHLIERAAARLAAEGMADLAPPPPASAPEPPKQPDTAAPPLGDTLDLAALARGGLVMGSGRSRTAEEFRIAATRLLHEMRADAPAHGLTNLTMVTSARPGEGKTFTALNLAASLAREANSAVLLIDADAKPGSLSERLGLKDRPGLTNLTASAVQQPEMLLVPTAVRNLAILPVGTAAHMSPASGEWHSIPDLIGRVARRFLNHFILLDIPPCLSTSDATALAPLVQQIVLVIEAERTQRGEILAALDLIKSCQRILLLLNKITTTSAHMFGAYYYGPLQRHIPPGLHAPPVVPERGQPLCGMRPGCLPGLA